MWGKNQTEREQIILKHELSLSINYELIDWIKEEHELERDLVYGFEIWLPYIIKRFDRWNDVDIC